eukprot:jgi/Tetstr1/462108/TSEL_007176.t1
MGACVFVPRNLDLDAKVRELLASYYWEDAFSAEAADLLKPCGEDWLASQLPVDVERTDSSAAAALMPAASTDTASRPTFFRSLYRKLSCAADAVESVIDIDMERKHSYESYSSRDYLRPKQHDWRARPASRESSGAGSRRESRASDASAGSRPTSANQSDRFSRAWDAAREVPERVAEHVRSSFQGAPPERVARPVKSSSAADAGASRSASKGASDGSATTKGKRPTRSSVSVTDLSMDDLNLHERMAQMDTVTRQAMQDEISEFAAAIGINPELEPHLMDIAEEFYASPLPEGWKEYWTDDHAVYYVMKAKKHSQWEHPMEHFYKAQVFLRRCGFRMIEEEQVRNPPTVEEVEEMAEYLGVDTKTEPDMLDTVKMAIGAPLPPEWHEDRSGTTYVHANGAISKNHPLDVYFLETIRKHREEKKRVEREGREAIKRAHSKAIARIIQAKGDHFGILGISRSASKRDIRMKYRGLALEVHPDKNKQAGATDAFHMLNDAFRECMDMTQATYRPTTTQRA